MALHGALCLHNFRKRSNHAGLRTYMKVYRYMKKVGLQRYLISSIKPSFFECSHDVNSYIISIAYSPCACKKILLLFPQTKKENGLLPNCRGGARFFMCELAMCAILFSYAFSCSASFLPMSTPMQEAIIRPRVHPLASPRQCRL